MARLLVLVLLVAGFAGCGGGSSSTSPSNIGAVVVESENLVAVNDACHVQGTVLNTSDSTTFDVSLRWQAYDVADKILGTTAITISSLVPGERRAYDATGIAGNDTGLVRCSQIARFEQISATANPH